MPKKSEKVPPENLSLTEFLQENTEIIPINSVSDLKKVDQKQPQYYFVGHRDCGFSQLGAPHFEVACDREKEKQCHLIDGGTEEGQKIINKLGFDIEGFPTLFVKNGDETIKVTGMRNAPQMREILSKSKSVLGKKHKVGRSIFPI